MNSLNVRHECVIHGRDNVSDRLAVLPMLGVRIVAKLLDPIVKTIIPVSTMRK